MADCKNSGEPKGCIRLAVTPTGSAMVDPGNANSRREDRSHRRTLPPGRLAEWLLLGFAFEGYTPEVLTYVL